MVPCPHCGEPLMTDATFCRECGSDWQTGFKAEAHGYDSVDLGEDEQDEAYAHRYRKNFWTYSCMALAGFVLAILPIPFDQKWRIGAIVLSFFGTMWLLNKLGQKT